MVDEMVRDAHHRIAIVYQDDAFGQDGLDGAMAALKSHGLKPVAVTTVQRNSAQVGEALDDLMAVKASGIVIVSAYVSSAALSTALRDRGSSAQIMNVSFVGTQALQKAMPVGEANGIGVAQVVPFPWNRWIPVDPDRNRSSVFGGFRRVYGEFCGWSASDPGIVIPGNRVVFLHPCETGLMKALAQELHLIAQGCWGLGHRRVEA